MTRFTAVLLLTTGLLAAPAARAQPVPVEEMSTPQALDYLRGALIAQGTVTVQIDYADSRSGDHWTHTFATQFRDVTINPGACNLSYHRVQFRDGKPFADNADYGVNFGKVAATTYGPLAGRFQEIEAGQGNPTWSLQAQPDVWHVTVFGANGGYNEFQFYSPNIAGDVQKAVGRLRALCGGG
jgi:hypothetical protein